MVWVEKGTWKSGNVRNELSGDQMCHSMHMIGHHAKVTPLFNICHYWITLKGREKTKMNPEPRSIMRQMERLSRNAFRILTKIKHSFPRDRQILENELKKLKVRVNTSISITTQIKQDWLRLKGTSEWMLGSWLLHFCVHRWVQQSDCPLGWRRSHGL